MDLLPNIQIKKLGVKDFEKLKRFHVKHCSDYVMTDSSIRAYLSMPQYAVFGAFHVKQIIGFLIILKSMETADIVYISVAMKFRSLGIASKMLISFINNYNVKEIFLEVDVNNIFAISFYKKMNFRIVSLRKRYLKGNDAYLMKLSC